MKLTDEEKAWLKKAAKASKDRIKSSQVFLSIWSEGLQKDPLCALQIGLAVLMDKPIGIIAPEGQALPLSLLRVSAGVNFYRPEDPDDLERSTKALLRHMDAITSNSPRQSGTHPQSDQ